ncbi:hypothetical protein KTD13_01795 [Burkholderia multivorans]|uniref:hypothetical protein n=1 Tax=Burkholderia multivorans TaxID=87883 RepID=UPI001C2418D1|nr:hypothetical protein [Burkholderia multivorans]MBU9259079.1 hypothetical protein [Burkholderia multivorans]
MREDTTKTLDEVLNELDRAEEPYRDPEYEHTPLILDNAPAPSLAEALNSAPSKKPEHVHFEIDKQLKSDLQAFAKKHNVSVARVIKTMLRMHLYR